MDTDDEYKSRPRAYDLTYAEDSAGKLGKGSKTQNSQSRARATRVVSHEGKEEIEVAYLNNDTEAETSVYKKWVELGASYAELRDIIMDVDVSDRSENAIYSHVYRYVTGKTGHEKRDNTAAGRDDIKRRKTGAKTEKKGSNSKGTGWKKMTDESDAWSTLLTKVQADSVFYGEWQRRESDPDLGVIAFSKMSPDLAQFVADQRSTYTVSSMAALLHMQEKTFRTNLVKKYGEAKPPQATDGDGDVEMELV